MQNRMYGVELDGIPFLWLEWGVHIAVDEWILSVTFDHTST